MKRYLLFVLAALTAGFAQANLVGLESEVYAESPYGTVYRVYATFDTPTDELVAVYALETAPMELSVTTSFYQDAVGGTLGSTINPAFFGAFPSLEFDSWFTIGSSDSNGTSDIQQVGMDAAFSTFESGSGFTLNTFVGGSFFLIPNVSSDAEAGADGRVLIGQFTTDGVVSLTVNLQWDDVDTNTSNSQGVSISFPFVAVSGCTSASADNYDSSATEDDGSCTYGGGLLSGLSYEVVAVNPLETGQNTYRLFADFSSPDVEVTAVYGTDTTPWQMVSDAADGFYNDVVGSDFGGGVNPLFFGSFPDLEYDSWFTIGAQPGDDDGLNSAFDSALTSFADFNSGGNFVVNTFIGGSIFVVPGANYQGVPVAGKVLLGQFTTSGVVDAVVNIQFRNAAQESIYAEGVSLTFPQVGVGCTDATACNYDPSAELDNGSCSVNDDCGVCGGDNSSCGGCTDASACNYDSSAVIDDGSCAQDDMCGVCGGDASTCSGCMNPDADNYDASAMYDDGSCAWGDGLCTGLSYEVVSSDPLGTGATTYRLYANFTADASEVTAVYGTDTNPWEMTSSASDGFYNDAVGSDFGGGVNPLFFASFPNLEFDSWFTIGAQPGDDDGLNSAFDSALTSLDDFNSGGDFVVNTFIGGSIFVVPGANSQGVPVAGKVLLGQFTTSGQVNALVNVQIRDQSAVSHYAEGMSLTFPACTDIDSCGVCGGDNSTCSGCTDPNADNYDSEALFDDGSCMIMGCTNPSAENYNPEATDDDGSCLAAGCTYSSADNYDAGNTSDDGSCIFSGCTDPLAENFNALANNDDGSCDMEPCTGGNCPFDTNGDGEIGSADLLEFLIAYGSICVN